MQKNKNYMVLRHILCSSSTSLLIVLLLNGFHLLFNVRMVCF